MSSNFKSNRILLKSREMDSSRDEEEIEQSFIQIQPRRRVMCISDSETESESDSTSKSSSSPNQTEKSITSIISDSSRDTSHDQTYDESQSEFDQTTGSNGNESTPKKAVRRLSDSLNLVNESQSESDETSDSSQNRSPPKRSVKPLEESLQIISESESEHEVPESPPKKPMPPPLELSMQILTLSDEETPTTSVKNSLSQPKITTLLPIRSRSKDSSKTKRVSQEFYNRKTKEYEDLKQEYANAKIILDKLGKSLHDGGKQLEIRVQTLERRLDAMKDEMSQLVVEEPKKIQPAIPPIETQSWDDISAEVDKIMPVHTGRQGLNTFNTQKALTVDRLKDLHGSLETCPNTDQQADDPNGLKVTLMGHQKQALVWLHWREHQKPPGGIFADDMGLGKTLTMISLILSSKYKSNDEEESDDSDSSNNDGSNSFSRSRKTYCKGGTLIICPASVLGQWEGEIETKVMRQKLSVCVHHGGKRDTKPRYLASYDVVITTYNIASREAQTRAALFNINWKRIILDEAHVIRNHKSKSSLAVCELKAKYRWAITGTPIQNKEMDLYALLKFLKCSPFDDLSNWKKWIDNKSASGQQRLNTLIKSLLLRRTKAQLQEEGNLNCLPEWKFETFDVNLDKEEMNVYQTILSFSKNLFAQYLLQREERQGDFVGFSHPTSGKTQPHSKALNHIYQKFCGNKEIKSYEILVLLLRLRQICCHTGLIYEMLQEDENPSNAVAVENEPNIDLVDVINELTISDTFEKLSLSNDEDAFTKATEKIMQRSNPVFNLSRQSSKMRKALEVIENFIVNTSDKCIVVSQWTASLNIFKNYLDERKIVSLALTGAIPVPDRQKIITEFNNPNTKPKVLLLSLTAGGVGLNLTGANHLLFLDPHWNPQLELQARDRIYRVGQKKPVFIYKFVCKHTVEERIFALQNHKLELARGVLMGVKASEGGKLSIDDLKSLFEM